MFLIYCTKHICSVVHIFRFLFLGLKICFLLLQFEISFIWCLSELSHPWSMTVPPKVTVSRGEDAVLWCSFTHPRQQDYSGLITVKWIARESRIGLFYSCSVKNTSMEELRECSASTLRYSLSGDPRRGELSLLIRKVELTDEGTFFCRVELDGKLAMVRSQVTYFTFILAARPEILSLSVMKSPSGSDSAPQRLRCEVEGHPPPKIVWLSASRRMKEVQVQTSKSGPYRVVSSVPYQEGEVLTCRAESRLGEVERGYPPSNTLMITLTVCGLIALLLLLLVGVLVYLPDILGLNHQKRFLCSCRKCSEKKNHTAATSPDFSAA
uniref:Ig-like domain-containing protein n=1 Tax=Monopterus albus TaxID=43700 RepID=A0A3Q3IWM3_MONAL